MSEKGNSTRNYIIDVAMGLFAEKGYQVVTMKDICDSCALSRGGLYRHFSSTKEIFIALLDRDIDDDIRAMKQAIEEKAPAKTILEHYLEHEKEAIFSEYKGLFFATHEFAFAEPDQRAYFDNRLALSVDLLCRLFQYGQDAGEFKQFDVPALAAHIIYFFDGLKTSSSVLTVTKELVVQQIKILKEMIVI